MRIAVLSDIHGNLPALEAVLADVERHDVDEVWCGGDIGWAGPWASECISLVRDRGWPTVKGNADVWSTGDPQTIEDEGRRAKFRRIAEAHALSEQDRDWLVNLPLGHSGKGSILLLHGSPDTPFEAPQPDAPPVEFKVYEAEASLVIYGHVHQAFTRRLIDGTVVANSGSVGLPLDHLGGSYLLIDQYGTDVTLRHRRIAFDRDRVRKKAEEIGGALAETFLPLFETPER